MEKNGNSNANDTCFQGCSLIHSTSRLSRIIEAKTSSESFISVTDCQIFLNFYM